MNTNEKAPDNAVCGPNGKPIAFPEDMWDDSVRVAGLVKERFDRDYMAKRGEDGDKQVYLVPVDPMAEKALTIPERAAVEAFAWYCREYSGGLKRNVSVTFPKIIHDRSDAKSIVDEEPLSFGDEGRAYMFAEVAGYCFPVDAQVIETPAGWAVTVSNEHSGLSAEELAHLQGACRVLMNFTVEAADGACASQSAVHKHHTPSPKIRQTWRDRKNSQMIRIEDGINAILAHLGHPTADSIATGAELVANIESAARDRHTRQAKPKSKTASKRSA